MIEKIAFGGGCHWCTEAVFQSLIGVEIVEQGFVASTGANDTFSEAVVVHFDKEKISLRELLTIHLHTHASTSEHRMRVKYRSAVYAFSAAQIDQVNSELAVLRKDFEKKLVIKVLPFRAFRPSEEQFRNYYYNDPEKPFCKTYIQPKLDRIAGKFPDKLKNRS